jgi:hypothetical protein
VTDTDDTLPPLDLDAIEAAARTPAYFARISSRYWKIVGDHCLPVSRRGRVHIGGGRTMRVEDVAPIPVVRIWTSEAWTPASATAFPLRALIAGSRVYDLDAAERGDSDAVWFDGGRHD